MQSMNMLQNQTGRAFSVLPNRVKSFKTKPPEKGAFLLLIRFDRCRSYGRIRRITLIIHTILIGFAVTYRNITAVVTAGSDDSHEQNKRK